MPKGIEKGDLTMDEFVAIVRQDGGDKLKDRDILERAGHGSLSTITNLRRTLLHEAARHYSGNGLPPDLTGAIFRYGKAIADEEHAKCKNALDGYQDGLDRAKDTISSLEAEVESLKKKFCELETVLLETQQTAAVEKAALRQEADFHRDRHAEVASESISTKRDLEVTRVRLEAVEKTALEISVELDAEKKKCELHHQARVESEKQCSALEASLASKDELVQHFIHEKQELQAALEALRSKANSRPPKPRRKDAASEKPA